MRGNMEALTAKEVYAITKVLVESECSKFNNYMNYENAGMNLEMRKRAEQRYEICKMARMAFEKKVLGMNNEDATTDGTEEKG